MTSPLAKGRSKRSTPQAIARQWLHDLVCMSEGCDGLEHARRTQTSFARDAVAAWKAGDDLGPIIHRHTCLGCPVPLEHAFRLNDLGELLVKRWEAA